MNNRDAKFIARVFSEILNVEASTFRIPRKPVAEGQDAPPFKYGVVLDQSGQMFGSVQAAREYINGN